MCDQQCLRSACAYAQSEQSIFYSLDHSMSVMRLTEHHMEFMFSFISFRRNINYLLPRLLNFWKPDTLPRITNCYDVHAYMPQHQYLAFFVFIITVYTSLYYILKHKIYKRNNIYVCDGKHRPEHFLFIHKTKFHNKKFSAS